MKIGNGGGNGVRARLGSGDILGSGGGFIHLLMLAAIAVGIILLAILILLVIREYRLQKKKK